jgi:hypothetical protein
MGLDVYVTQSSRYEGIGVVAYNKTDIVHQAEILIHAKRYSCCVPANDVSDLAGSVEENALPTGCWLPPRGSAQEPRPWPPATTRGSSKAASSSSSLPSTSN